MRPVRFEFNHILYVVTVFALILATGIPGKLVPDTNGKSSRETQEVAAAPFPQAMNGSPNTITT